MEVTKRYGDPAQRDALKDKRLRAERNTISKRVVRILTDVLEGLTAMELMEYFPKHMKSTVQARLSELSNVVYSPPIVKTGKRRMGGAGIKIHVWQTPDNFMKTERIRREAQQQTMTI